MGEATDTAADLATLREQHPSWFFCSSWIAAATGPDKRMLIAQRRGVILSDLSAANLSEKIRQEEQR